jgi:phage protein D
MAQERLVLKTSAGELVLPRTDFLSLEVELDNELASLFKLRLAIRLQPNGAWTYVDDERFQVWKPLAIHAGFDTATDELISGYITHIRPEFQRDPSYCTLEIWGMDSSVLMDREETLHAWPNERDSTIATQIFNRYSFSPKVDDTRILHDENISTIMQRETDMQFLNRLAQRNGFECYVEGTTGFFRAPQLNATPQPVLAVHFGERDTNVNHFSLEVNALTPTSAGMFEVDWLTKTVLQESAETGQQRVLGSTAATGLLAAGGVAAGKVYINTNAATGKTEMARLCQESVHQAEWLVTAEGEIDGNQYAHVLKPHGTVTIKGVGETHSGIYYVTHVTHTFGPRGYTQFFRAQRNALRPTGVEDFAGTVSKPNPYL